MGKEWKLSLNSRFLTPFYSQENKEKEKEKERKEKFKSKNKLKYLIFKIMNT